MEKASKNAHGFIAGVVFFVFTFLVALLFLSYIVALTAGTAFIYLVGGIAKILGRRNHFRLRPTELER
jgi:energy-coupling factor transporter transmembrane protein EcfT